MTPKKLLYTLMLIAFQCILCTALFAQTSPPSKQWDKRFGGYNTDRLSSLTQTNDGGYILGGYSYSGVGADKTEASRGGADYWIVKIDANGIKQWDKRFGGTAWDLGPSLQQTTDGGYILGGMSYSGIGGDKTEDSRGSTDYWIVKIDVNGVKQWDKRFGGSAYDQLTSLQQTTDGGYILGGGSESGIGGDKTEDSRGMDDYWIVKIDSNGIKQWDKRFGGTESDYFETLQQTTDGGYILGGYSFSGISGDKTEDIRGMGDYWIIKTDANGVKQWDKRYGGTDYDYIFSLQQTTDGGYILGGFSVSGIGGDKTEDCRGLTDYWIVKTDANGVKQWDKRFGGSEYDDFHSIKQTTDGGFILGGTSESGLGGDKTEDSRGMEDYWIVKTDANGEKQWDKRYGGYNEDYFTSLQQTTDGGFIFGGGSYSGANGDKTEETRGDFDYWIVKTEAEVLPVSLLNLKAAKENNLVNLTWQTVSEINTASFTVEHATDGKTFSAIGKVNAAGNSNTLMYYHFLHDHPGNGMHYYRLKTVDKDGQFSSSATASIYMGNDIAVLVYPNPTKGNITVIYNSTVNAAIQLNVIDITGKKLFTKTVQAVAGNNQYQLNLTNLSPGNYTLQVNNGTAQQQLKLVRVQ